MTSSSVIHLRFHNLLPSRSKKKQVLLLFKKFLIECLSSYGVIAIKKQITPRLFQVSHLVEKPKQHEAPSNLAVVGRYVLSGKIFKSLSELGPYAVDELQLTDAISSMIKNNEKLFAYKIQGTRYDIGTPIGWLKAMIALGLEHPQYAPHLKQFLSSIDTIDSYRVNQTKILRTNCKMTELNKYFFLSVALRRAKML